MIMTPHEEADCYTVSSIVRSLPPKKDFVVQWDYPLMSVTDLDPSELRSGATKQKKWTDREFIETCVPVVPARLKDIKLLTEKNGGNPRTAERHLKRLTEAGLIGYGSGLYWRKV
jgi:DNA-binding transcriptional ArsR family regulator